MKPKKWRSWRVCPECGSRATKLVCINPKPNRGSVKCQICEKEYDPPNKTIFQDN